MGGAFCEETGTSPGGKISPSLSDLCHSLSPLFLCLSLSFARSPVRSLGFDKKTLRAASLARFLPTGEKPKVDMDT